MLLLVFLGFHCRISVTCKVNNTYTILCNVVSENISIQVLLFDYLVSNTFSVGELLTQPESWDIKQIWYSSMISLILIRGAWNWQPLKVDLDFSPLSCPSLVLPSVLIMLHNRNPLGHNLLDLFISLYISINIVMVYTELVDDIGWQQCNNHSQWLYYQLKSPVPTAGTMMLKIQWKADPSSSPSKKVQEQKSEKELEIWLISKMQQEADPLLSLSRTEQEQKSEMDSEVPLQLNLKMGDGRHNRIQISRRLEAMHIIL